MVSLAKELEGKPVHIIASYCQHGTKENALAILKNEGWSDKIKNLTVMNQTNFPKAPITYVPYYLVFDQKGTLVKNHMAGIFHGGDKDTYQTIVKNLLVNQ